MSNKNPHPEHEEKFRLKDFVVFAGVQYCISTVDLGYFCIEYPFETLVLPAQNNKITSWAEKYGIQYRTQEEAVKGHKYVCEHLAEIIMGGSK